MKKLIVIDGTLKKGTCKCCKEASVKGLPRRIKCGNTTFGICDKCLDNAFRWNEKHLGIVGTVDAVSTDDHLLTVSNLTAEEAITLMIRFPKSNFKVVAKNQFGYTVKCKDEVSSLYSTGHLFGYDLKIKVDGIPVDFKGYHAEVKNELAWWREQWL